MSEQGQPWALPCLSEPHSLDEYAVGVREEEPTPPTPPDALEEEMARLHTWHGLMSLLDEHYPADIFDGSSGDPGPRIAVLIREINELRNAPPTPPTPDVGWIGTGVVTGRKLTALLVHGDRFAFINEEGELDALKLRAYTWEPPPEQEPARPTQAEVDAISGSAYGFRSADVAAAGGVPEPDPQPIAWQVRYRDDRPLIYATEDAAKRTAKDGFGRTVHAVMPAGWKPRGNDA